MLAVLRELLDASGDEGALEGHGEVMAVYSSTVANIQALLRLPSDGILGPRTAAAMRAHNIRITRGESETLGGCARHRSNVEFIPDYHPKFCYTCDLNSIIAAMEQYE